MMRARWVCCLHEEEQEVYGDKAYASQAHQKKAEGVRWKVLRSKHLANPILTGY